MQRSTSPQYLIRETARLSGLPESTLRFYEQIGLIPPVTRDPSSRHRRYSEADLDAVILVACLNATGMSIEDMRQYLANRQGGASRADEQIKLVQRQERRLGEELQLIRLRWRYLAIKANYWRATATVS